MSKFYRCEECKSVFLKTYCPGAAAAGESKLKELIPGTSDGAAEKHVPVVKVEGDTVKVTVGAVEHPMLEEHFITFIYLETEKGGQLANLKPGQPPRAEFKLAAGDKPVAVYEYCNLHGLWKADV